jgi:two-component system sensor histidine kinase YesM
MRYRNKFTYSIEVEEEGLLDCCVPKVLLQPLGENAIYHGIKNKADHGRIIIRAAADKEGLSLQVEDDGVGADSAKIKERLARGRLYTRGSGSDEDGSGPSGSGGLGLENVDNRIRLNYGESYGLDFDSERDEGTLVTLRLPMLGCPSETRKDREG